MARVFVGVSLPCRDPGDQPVWARQNGNAVLTVQQGFLKKDGAILGVGYPFGSTVRWIMLYVFSEAVRTQSPVIDLGFSMNQFLSRLGLAKDGRRLVAVRDQLSRLLAASIKYTFSSQDVSGGRDLGIAAEYVFCRPSEGGKLRGFVKINELLFRDLIDHAVPVDVGAVRALRDSPTAMDLFVFLSYRLRKLTRPVSMPWQALQSQLGSDFKKTKEFARHVRLELRRVHSVWPSLKFSFYCGGVTFSPPSQLPVSIARKSRK